MTGRNDEGTGLDQISGLQTVGGMNEGTNGQRPPPKRGQLPELPDLDENPSARDAGPAVATVSFDPDYYSEPRNFRGEMRRAPKIFKELSLAVAQMVTDVRLGKMLDVSPVRRPLKNMIASAVRHPDALMWMTKLHVSDNYLTGHAVRCSILATALARHLGIAEQKMERLALGSLLCQIGKAKLPKQLLEKRTPLKPEEMDRLRQYVNIGVELLRRCDGIFEDVIEIVESHQERFDGSGYPSRKWGDEIPLLARVAGLVHCYDAMTSLRPHTDQVSSTAENLDFLYEQRDVLFQGQLIEEFIQMLGIYPTGTLVELNNGVVALVIAQNVAHRTQPQLLMVLDNKKDHFKNYEKIDILEYNEKHPDRPVTIKRAVNATEYEIDPQDVMEKHTARKWSIGRFLR